MMIDLFDWKSIQFLMTIEQFVWTLPPSGERVETGIKEETEIGESDEESGAPKSETRSARSTI